MLSGNFYGLENSVWDFFSVIFGPGMFWGFVGRPGDFLGF